MYLVQVVKAQYQWHAQKPFYQLRFMVHPEPASVKDDSLTIISISVLACIVQDILHEGLGHGVTAWLSGAHRLTMSTVALQSDIETRWIAANGTLVNLFFAGIFWLILLRPQRFKPTTYYFLVLAMAGNLFTATGYFFFSGVANFGDWAAVIRGLQPHWLWRLGLVLLGAASYYASMLVVSAELKHFHGEGASSRRLRSLSWTPYFTDGILAGIAGIFNPAGLFYGRSLGPAINPWCKCRPAEPAEHDAQLEGQGRRPDRTDWTQSWVDCCGCDRRPAVHIRTWPRNHLVAMRRPSECCKGPGRHSILRLPAIRRSCTIRMPEEKFGSAHRSICHWACFRNRDFVRRKSSVRISDFRLLLTDFNGNLRQAWW